MRFHERERQMTKIGGSHRMNKTTAWKVSVNTDDLIKHQLSAEDVPIERTFL